MAMALEHFTFGGAGSKGKKYNWHAWTDGQAWQLDRGTDFSCTIKTMQLQAYKFAKSMGIKVHVKPVDENTIVLQFYTAA